MTFILVDDDPEKDALVLANRHWRPIADEVVRSKLIEGQRSKTITIHVCTKVEALETKAISEHLRQLLKKDGLPKSIDPNAAQSVVDFASASDGFEVS